MKRVGRKGKNFVPDQEKVNRIEVEVGILRLTRDMRWDNYFQELRRDKEEREEEDE